VTDVFTENPPETDHQPKRRGRKPGQKIEKRREIPDEVFDGFAEVAEDDRAAHRRRREERSEKQQALDATVLENYNQWRAAGMPTNWADMPVITWTVPDSYVEDAEFMLRKSAGLYGRKISWGQRESELDNEGNPNGRTVIPFCIVAKPRREKKEES
jgi:hypothetical protein